MLDVGQLKAYIVRPVLDYLNLHKDADSYKSAECLLVGTALQESLGKFLRQVNEGPAIGLFQMERATFNDINEKFLAYKPALQAKLHMMSIPGQVGDAWEELAGNLYLACAYARVHYYRVPERLPSHLDVPGMARYWKKYYNTVKGAGTVDEFIQKYQAYAYDESV